MAFGMFVDSVMACASSPPTSAGNISKKSDLIYGTTKNAERCKSAMSIQHDHTTEPSISTIPLDLCYLMIDLEVMAAELLAAEDGLGRAHQGSLADRLSRVGVSDQKVERFSAWRQTVSGLAGSYSRAEDQLAGIAAAEEAGLDLLDEIIEYLKTRKQPASPSNTKAVAVLAA
jgi:hypothetical protein